MTRKFLASTAAAAFALMAAQAQAQTPAAAPAAAPPPTIPGICVINPDGVIATSVVGKYANTRIGEINSAAAAEVNGQGTTLNADKTKFEADAKAYNAGFDGLTAEAAQARATTVQTQAQALQTTQQGLIQREQQLQQLAEIRSREVDLTMEKARRTIIEAMQDPLKEVFQARSCAIMLDQNAVPLVASAMDVTRDVVAKLDVKIQQFAIEREALPAQQAGAQRAAAPRPATTAARPAAAPARPAAATPAKPRR